MLPSRGLRPAVSNAHKSLLSQSSLKPVLRQKKFSTASALTSRARLLTKSNSLLSSSRWGANDIRTPAAVSSISAIRFNSTSQTATPPVPPSAGTDASPLPSFDELTAQLSTTTPDVSSIPEHIGYLHELGLNYGWGPTSMLEWVLEHVHVYSGMPWWGSIATTAILVRVACFPLYLRMTDTVAKQAALAPILKPLQEKQQYAIQAKDQVLMQVTLEEMRQVYRTAGIKLRNTFIGPIIQGVLGYCTFKLTRAMANLPVPGLQTGGFAWLTDLTVPDPYFILPLTTAVIMHLVGRRGGESGVQQLTEGQRKIFLYALPGVAAVATAWLPGVTQLSFVTASTVSILQSIAFRQPGIRAALKLTPLYQTPARTPKVINATATSKAGYGTSSRINMAPTYQAPNAPASTTNAESQEPKLTLQKIANAPFEPLAKAVKSSGDWARNTVFKSTGKNLDGSAPVDTGKRKGTLAGRRK